MASNGPKRHVERDRSCRVELHESHALPVVLERDDQAIVGDVDVIAPSLYVGRNNGGRRKSDQEQPANASAVARASGAAPAATSVALPASAASSSQDEVPVGHFGNANPFRRA